MAQRAFSVKIKSHFQTHACNNIHSCFGLNPNSFRSSAINHLNNGSGAFSVDYKLGNVNFNNSVFDLKNAI